MKKVYGKYILLCCIVVVVALGVRGCAKEVQRGEEERREISYERLKSKNKIDKNTKLEVWYVEEEDRQLLQEASEAFEEKYSIKIQCEQKEKDTYLEELKASKKKGKNPDLYLIPNDELQEKKEEGLAKKVGLFTQPFLEKNYAKTAVNAVSLKDGIYGYPLYFDTWFLLYNTDYVKKEPKTFEEMLEYGEQVSDEWDNTSLFKWDLTNPYVNYLFLGNQVDLFGKTGDAVEKFKINRKDTAEAMKYFQELSNFPIGTVKTLNYNSVLRAVRQNEALFAICKTDVIKKIGRNAPYKVALIPNLNDEMKSRGISVTQIAVVNGYSDNPEEAELFGSYLSYEFANQQYDTIGKLSSRKGIYYDDERFPIIYKQYEQSIPLPKIKERKKFWNYLTLADINIWNGSPITKELNQVQKSMEKLLKK